MTSLSLLLRRAGWLTLCAVAATGCGDELPNYDELIGFRVVALRASPSSLNEGERTTLDALTFVEGEDSPTLRYRWSWCPARLPSSVGGGCALDEAEFARLLGVDEGEIDFDLGDDATAEFIYPGRAELFRAACENAADTQADGAVVFSCEGGFPVSIRADITHQKQTIRVQKNVRLLFGDLQTNENPELGAVSIVKLGSKREPEPWREDEAFPVELGEDYRIFVDVDQDAAELFVPEPTVVDPKPAQRRESLFISWFSSSGAMEWDRTSLIEGVTLEEFGKNEWSLPKSGDEERDGAQVILVLRDERGGVSWLSRKVEFVR